MSYVFDNFAGDYQIEYASRCRIQIEQIPRKKLYSVAILESTNSPF